MSDIINAAPGECGTVCCIAGAVIRFEVARQHDGKMYNSSHISEYDFNNIDHNNPYRSGSLNIAGELCGLILNDQDELFCPNFTAPGGIDFDDITPQQAAKTIRHFLKTREVDWAVAIPSGDSNDNA